MYKEIAANKRKSIVLIAFFVLLTGVLGYLFALYMNEPSITPFVLIGAGVYALVTYYASSSMALSFNRARPIAKRDNPRLYRVVENLAITDGLPTPSVYVIADPAPNAFATGRDPRHASVCVTQGLLDMMSDTELEGVIAHEMGHIKNYDIRVSMVAFALVAVIGLLADIMLRMSWFRDSDEDNQLFFILGIVAALIAPLVAMLIQLAISRKREYLADATGALTTRYPDGLASALEKIKKANEPPMQRQSTSTAHLFFSNPLKKRSLSGLFSTHPPIDERIKRLHEMGGHA